MHIDVQKHPEKGLGDHANSQQTISCIVTMCRFKKGQLMIKCGNQIF